MSEELKPQRRTMETERNDVPRVQIKAAQGAAHVGFRAKGRRGTIGLESW